MRVGILAVFVFIWTITTYVPVSAYDNGPQVVACEYKFGQSAGSDKCLLHGSGTNQGITWAVFEIKQKRFRYVDSSPNSIELLNKSNKTIAKYAVTHTNTQCRPGGKPADAYMFSNGDRVCIYW